MNAASRLLRVLIVDDEPDNADSLGMLVKLWGHEVRVAYGGPRGLALATDFRPDVMLIDLSMPGISGNELASQLRKRAGHEHVLMVAVTGHGFESDYRESKQAGFDHLLLKPADPDVICDMLAKKNAKLLTHRQAV